MQNFNETQQFIKWKEIKQIAEKEILLKKVKNNT